MMNYTQVFLIGLLFVLPNLIFIGVILYDILTKPSKQKNHLKDY